MTDKDKGLIAEAKKLHFSCWGEAFDLAEQADTEQARRVLKDIGIALYHKEESHAGLD